MRIDAGTALLEVKEHGPGDGPALILIRGLGTQLVHWPGELVQGFAARGYRTVIFDNRDVGLSQRFPAPGVPDSRAAILKAVARGHVPAPAYGLDDMAGDVIGLMDALGIRRAHVFGISMGGMIAQIMALRHRDRLNSAIIVMSAAGLRDPGLLERLLVEDLEREAYIDAWVAAHGDFGSPGFPMPEPDIRAEAGRAFDRGAEAAGVNRQALATMAAPDLRDELSRLDLPCLVIHGLDDTLIPPESGREIAGLIPGAELELVPGMGHIITPGAAEPVIGLVDGFIRRVGG